MDERFRARTLNSTDSVTARIAGYRSARLLALRLATDLTIMRVAGNGCRRARCRLNGNIEILAEDVLNCCIIDDDDDRISVVVAYANTGSGLRILNDIRRLNVDLIEASGRHVRVLRNVRGLDLLYVFFRRRGFITYSLCFFLGTLSDDYYR